MEKNIPSRANPMAQTVGVWRWRLGGFLTSLLISFCDRPPVPNESSLFLSWLDFEVVDEKRLVLSIPGLLKPYYNDSSDQANAPLA